MHSTARDGAREPWTFRWNDFPSLAWAAAAGRIPEGRISSEWRRRGERIAWKIGIPAGAEAKALIPAPAGDIRANGRPVAGKAAAEGIRSVCATAGSGLQELTLGSGTYEFDFPAPSPKTNI